MSSIITSAKPSARRTVLKAIPIPELPGFESRMVLLEYPPGYSAPLHHHPIAGPNYVLEGDITTQFEGGDVERFTTGDVFVDLRTTMHVRAENASATKWLKLLACYVVEVGAPNVVF